MNPGPPGAAPAGSPLRRWSAPAAVLALFAALVVPRLSLVAAPFRYEGEAREAECVADVLGNSNWIAPLPNGDRIPTKGPFLYWASAAICLVLGSGEAAIRLSVVLFALGTVLCTARIGALLGSPRNGWMAAAILSTATLFWGQTVYLRVDMPLAFFVTLTLMFFLTAVVRPRERLAAHTLALAALACGCLTKGAVALVPTLPPIAIFLAVRRDGSTLRIYAFALGVTCALLLHPALLAVVGALALIPVGGTEPGPSRRWLDLVPGLVFAGVLCGWLWLADARYEVSYIRYALWESTSRVAGTADHGANFTRPFYWYLPKFAGDFLPWTLLLPVAIVGALKTCRADRRSPFLLVALWFAVTFLLFSVFSYKRKPYLLPLYPAAALMVAWACDARAVPATRLLEKSWTFLRFAAAAVAAVAALDLVLQLAGHPFFPRRRPDWTPFVEPWRPALDLLLLAVGVLWFRALAPGPATPARAPLAFTAGWALLLAAAGFLLSTIEKAKGPSPADFSRSVRDASRPGRSPRFLADLRDHAVLFYLSGTRIPQTRVEDLPSWEMEARRAPVLFIAYADRPLPPLRESTWEELSRGQGSSGELRLLRLVPRPAPETGLK